MNISVYMYALYAYQTYSSRTIFLFLGTQHGDGKKLWRSRYPGRGGPAEPLGPVRVPEGCENILPRRHSRSQGSRGYRWGAQGARTDGRADGRGAARQTGALEQGRGGQGYITPHFTKGRGGRYPRPPSNPRGGCQGHPLPRLLLVFFLSKKSTKEGG